MFSILFVDDDPSILEGLRRMLQPMGGEWEMAFAAGGADVLKAIEGRHFDVVVSDLRMPGIDGSQALQEVMGRWPQTVRIVLSGYSEKDATIKSIAHQHLAKPCDAETLIAAVDRVRALRDMLADERLFELVSRMKTVPSLPSLYTQLITELRSSDSNLSRIAEIVKEDIGMTVKLLQIVNSSFFGLRRTVSDAGEAIQFLGLDTITSLTLGIGIFTQLETKGGCASTLAALWAHSVAVGSLAKTIADRQHLESAKDAFTAGLLHDIGKLVLAVNMPDQYKSVSEMVAKDAVMWTDAEEKVFGVQHAQVGAYLLGLWGLPQGVVEAVAFHHAPSCVRTDAFNLISAVHIAESMIDPNGTECSLDEEYVARLGLTDAIPKWRDAADALRGHANGAAK